MPDCSDIRKQWDEAFDSGDAPTPVILRHLAGCGNCRRYTNASVEVRESLQGLPLGAADDAADQAILRALRAERIAQGPVRSPVMPLVFAGAGSFALTLIVAGVMLSAASGTPALTVSPPSGIASRPGFTYIEPNAENDDWLASPGLVSGVRGRRAKTSPPPPKRPPLRSNGESRGRVA